MYLGSTMMGKPAIGCKWLHKTTSTPALCCEMHMWSFRYASPNVLHLWTSILYHAWLWHKSMHADEDLWYPVWTCPSNEGLPHGNDVSDFLKSLHWSKKMHHEFGQTISMSHMISLCPTLFLSWVTFCLGDQMHRMMRCGKSMYITTEMGFLQSCVQRPHVWFNHTRIGMAMQQELVPQCVM